MREDQLAISEFDRLSEKRDQNGKVQDDQVPAKATPRRPNCASNWSDTLSRFTCMYKPLKPSCISSNCCSHCSRSTECLLHFVPADKYSFLCWWRRVALNREQFLYPARQICGFLYKQHCHCRQKKTEEIASRLFEIK